MRCPDPIRISQTEPVYPAGLRAYLGEEASANITAAGNLGILAQRNLALFCSVKCPGRLILETYDLSQRLRQEGLTVIGGFHSPMEQECLVNLLRGTQPVIICLARALTGKRLRSEFAQPLAQGRLLLLSPFDEKERRATVRTALYRNRFVAALADKVFVAHAAPSGKTEAFCREVLGWGKPLYTLDSDANENLMAMGATPVSAYGGLGWI